MGTPAPQYSSGKRIALPPITPVERSRRLPVSFAQQRLCFLDQWEGVNQAYYIAFGFHLRGDLDSGVLRRALDRIVARHESLRTTFIIADGDAVQQIGSREHSRFQLAEHDLRGVENAEVECERLMQQEVSAEFDLERGPLIRGCLVRHSKEEHVLLISMHHIVSDGWSIGVWRNELSILYRAFLHEGDDPLPALNIQYADYAVWQRECVASDILPSQTNYWKEALAGIPVLLEIPTDRPRPPRQDYAGGFVRFALDETVTAGLKQLARRHGTTLFMTLLAGWVILLARLSGECDVVVGTPVGNRARAEIERLIGFFVNMLALRLNVTGLLQTGQALALVKEQVLAAQRNQDLPFEQVVEIVRPERSLSHTPLFQVMFAWQKFAAGDLVLPHLKVESLDLEAARRMSKFDLSLVLHDENGTIAGGLEYAHSLFDAVTVERYLGYYRALLQGMIAAETRAVDELPMLGKRERDQILYQWNDGSEDYACNKCVHTLFEEQVERTPDAVALLYQDQQLTYSELNRQANRLAHYLRGLGVKPDTRVGVCLERSPEMVVGFLAIWKAGGAYVPLDPAYPSERLLYMLEDSTPIVLLTEAHLKQRLQPLPATVSTVDVADTLAWSNQPECNLQHGGAGLHPEHLAYVIYTSGSTGQPKGVLIEHGNVARLFAATHAWFQFRESDVWTVFHSYSFDFSVWEIWGALLYGGRLVVVSRDTARSPDEFYKLVCWEKVTILNQTPSAFRAFTAAQANSDETHRLRHVIFGGEALELATLRPWYKQNPGGQTRLVNMYGISETTVHVTYRPLEACDSETPAGCPIGCRIPDLKVYILDRHGEPVPVGVRGELYIGGAGVARGYLNRPELTAERFLPDLYTPEAGARMYKTGDVGRWLAEGNIEFLGRNDAQVKIRGYRIELGEIEARLLDHRHIREAVVEVRGEGAEKRLLAYYTTKRLQAEIAAGELRTYVAGRLPEYMVPAAYIRLDAMPLTANGKLDRQALPEAEADAHASRQYEAPQGEVERAVAAIWAEVLQLERVGRYDSFFELGGHSLLAMRVISRLQKKLQVKIAPTDLFARPELVAFSCVVASASRTAVPLLTRVEPRDQLELSFAQQRLFFLDQLEPGSSAYNVPYAVRLKGILNLHAVRETVGEIVRRHEVLRTTFAQSDAGPVQMIHPHTEFPVGFEDFSCLHAAVREGAMRQRVQQEAERPFDLMHGPVYRVRILQLGADDHVLLMVRHHIVTDGWSEHILLQEFARLYAAFSAGAPSPLQEPVLQYADFAVWQRKWLQGPLLGQQLDYWKTALQSMQGLELPVDSAGSNPTYANRRMPFSLTTGLAQKVRRLSQSEGVTLFMTLTSAFHLLLGWYANQDDVSTGTDVANRNRPEIEGMIGFFVNQLVLRTSLAGDPTFSELLQRVRTATLGAYAHQEIPFEKVVEELSPNRMSDRLPLFNVKLVFQNTPAAELSLPGLQLEQIPVAPLAAKYLLLFTLRESAGTVHGLLECQRDKFEENTIDLLLSLFREILNIAVESPGVRLSAMKERLHTLKELHQRKQRASLQHELKRRLAFTKRKDVSLA